MWRRPKFWQKKFSLISFLLLPFSFLYGGAVFLRLKRTPHRVGIKVISIGNFIAGGAGKTPTALYVARALKRQGRNPFILTRGYGGSIKETCLVEPQKHRASEVGDEALMMARYFPTLVGADRVRSAQRAAQSGADIVVLDDGFQNPQLHKDLSLLVVDRYGFGNGRLLPAGPLRERPSSALKRAQGVIVIGAQEADLPPLLQQLSGRLSRLPLIYGEIKNAEHQALPQQAIAFAGIGAPEKFWQTLEASGVTLLERYGFADHYVYKEKDAEFLLERARQCDAALLTTEKDGARLAHSRAPSLALLAEKTYTIPIELNLKHGEDSLHQLLERL